MDWCEQWFNILNPLQVHLVNEVPSNGGKEATGIIYG